MPELEEMVLEAFKKAGKPLRPGEVAEMLGVDKKEIDAVIKKLKKEGKIHSPKRCYYAPL
jgi:biotin operon repressor